MGRRLGIGAMALAIIAAALYVGLRLGAAGLIGLHPATMTGDATVGEAKVMTVMVGDTAYGVRDAVPWTDATGTAHDGGWPACLVPGEVKGLSFTGAVVWQGDVGMATVLWVDCRGH